MLQANVDGERFFQLDLHIADTVGAFTIIPLYFFLDTYFCGIAVATYAGRALVLFLSLRWLFVRTVG